ncbi:protein SODIUM POTASSIUM ROOT DEFECTIVE 2-like isoform X2 [Lycium barbarum]|uniref:protein SODIUM POTASSIUM ROOT DEFECTIVE 2-like isoform X2 n=1 Tax=Lycium barbarum TaxID=112863 RepID=UPI00293F51C5|nr:protein SODIUM POTASSIUM ROOT DEFECTIVE 2-like isoform X2 [Lycium barbarum]
MNYKKLGGCSKMRGFMCQPEVSTAVCMNCDSRSVIVPVARRRMLMEEHAKLINNYSKCTRLGDVPRTLGSMPITANATTISRRSRNAADAVGSSVSSVPVLTISKRDQENGSQIVPSLPSSDNSFQVVVMRVSLHCQGCAGKVKKHLSKMEGVTSFSIDLDSKRVTVMGHVSPVGVLESISKVKRAEFWP